MCQIGLSSQTWAEEELGLASARAGKRRRWRRGGLWAENGRRVRQSRVTLRRKTTPGEHRPGAAQAAPGLSAGLRLPHFCVFPTVSPARLGGACPGIWGKDCSSARSASLDKGLGDEEGGHSLPGSFPLLLLHRRLLAVHSPHFPPSASVLYRLLPVLLESRRLSTSLFFPPTLERTQVQLSVSDISSPPAYPRLSFPYTRL